MTTSQATKHRVAVDVDGVTANYTQFYLNIVRAATGLDIPKDWLPKQWDIDDDLGLTKQQRKACYELVNLPGQAQLIALYPGSVQGIDKLSKVADVFFVTSPVKTSPTWAYDRAQWLAEKFGKEAADQLISTHHKYAVAADILVDDKPDHCKEWSAAWPDGTPLLWKASYNAQRIADYGYPSVTNWDEVIHYVGLLPPSRYEPVERSKE